MNITLLWAKVHPSYAKFSILVTIDVLSVAIRADLARLKFVRKTFVFTISYYYYYYYYQLLSTLPVRHWRAYTEGKACMYEVFTPKAYKINLEARHVYMHAYTVSR